MVPSAATFQESVFSWGNVAARYGTANPRSSKIVRLALNSRLVVVSVIPPGTPTLPASDVGSARIAITMVRLGWPPAAGAPAGASPARGAVAGEQATAN